MIENEDEDGIDALIKSSIDNRESRFTRRDPVSYAEKSKNKEAPTNQEKVDVAQPQPARPQHHAQVHPAKPQAAQAHLAQPQAAQVHSAQTQAAPNNNSGVHVGNKINYCHFFSNYGRCIFEEKSGRKCRFSHLKAPTCVFDGRCNRQKCMFSHFKENSSVYRNNMNHNNQADFLARGSQNAIPPNPLQNQVAFLMQQMQQIQNQARWENAQNWQ